MNNETCKHGGSSPISMLERLPNSQGGSGRHRCPTCSFEQGFIFGSKSIGLSYDDFSNNLSDGESCSHGSIAPQNILLSLGDNQGGTGRHKCTNCAFKEGYIVGQLGAEEHTFQLNTESSFQLNLVPPPNLLINETPNKSYSKKVDFIALEIKNKQLGYQGELLVIQRDESPLVY